MISSGVLSQKNELSSRNQGCCNIDKKSPVGKSRSSGLTLNKRVINVDALDGKPWGKIFRGAIRSLGSVEFITPESSNRTFAMAGDIEEA